MIYICTKCGALTEINPINTEARYIQEKYGEIDSIINRSIEYICACKNPLTCFDDYIETTGEDIVIDYIINQSIKDYKSNDEKIQDDILDKDLRDLKNYEHH